MLYQLHEMQRTFLNPLMQWADASAKLYNNPVSPFAHTPMAQRVSAGYELMYRLGKDYEKPEFDINSSRSTATPVGIMSRSRSTSRSAACCASSASPTTRRLRR